MATDEYALINLDTCYEAYCSFIEVFDLKINTDRLLINSQLWAKTWDCKVDVTMHIWNYTKE